MTRPGILLLTMVFTLAYGLVHDQVTARLCVEYFTVAHPPLFATTSPALLGLGWAVAAAGPVGFLVGSVLATVAMSPGLPPVRARVLSSRLGRVFFLTAVAAVMMGGLAWLLAQWSVMRLPEEWGAAVPLDRHPAFMAVWCAHLASYSVGLMGSGLLLHRCWRERGRPRGLWFCLPTGRRQWARLAGLALVLIGVCVWRWGGLVRARGGLACGD